MRKVGAIIGIVAGACGVLEAAMTQLFGILVTAFPIDNPQAAVAAGWGGVFFAFMVIVFGGLAFRRPKGAGIGLILCSMAGALLGNIVLVSCMALASIGGLLCLARRKGPAPAQPSAVSADPS
ncbi:MAG: hypothetical protein ACLPXB_19145 [Thiobacillaceae bacterium]